MLEVRGSNPCGTIVLFMKLTAVLFSIAIFLFVAAVVMFFTGIELPGYICIAAGCTLLFVWVALRTTQIGKKE